MFLKLLLISTAFLTLAFLAMGIRILILRHGKFPEYHISSNPEMHKRGISCAQNTDTGYSKVDDEDCSGCRNIVT